MNLEYGQHPTFKLEPPKRVLDVSTQFFPDYGYKHPAGFIRALRISLKAHAVPHFVIVLGEPQSGKEHIVRDIAAKLFYKYPNAKSPKKRDKGVLQLIGEQQKSAVPIDYLGWGFMFSILKVKGLVSKHKVFGEFTPDEINLAAEELEDLTLSFLDKNKGKTALAFIKVPPVTATRFKGELFGVNLGFTPLEKIAGREARFRDFKYRDYWFAAKVDREVEIQGDQDRPRLENAVDDTKKLSQELEKAGETVLTPQGILTNDILKQTAEIILASANHNAVEKIRTAASNLAEEMERRGRFTLKPGDREATTALLLREILENMLKLKGGRRVFLGIIHKQPNRIFDLSVPIENYALIENPAIEGIRNK